MARQFFSGNSLDQAIMAAARTFSLDPTEVQYTVREKKHGFVNARKRVVIEVNPEAPKKEVVETDSAASKAPSESLSLLAGVKAPRPKRAPRDETRKAPGADEGSAKEDVHKPVRKEESFPDKEEEDVAGVEENENEDIPSDEVEDDDGERFDGEDEDDEDDFEGDDAELSAFLRAGNKLIDILDVELDVRVERRDEEFFVDFTGEEADLLTEDDGKILQAIEQLLPRMVRGLAGQGLPCTIDCDGFKEDKIIELKEMAISAAADVRDTGDEILLKPMSPADRRVVHMALADDPDVETESSGDGFMKRVRIVPA